MKLWIGRDNPIIPEDMEHYIERHPEDEIRYAKLHIFYDKPIWSGGCWRYSREMCEISNYMFPEIKPGECIEFKSEQFYNMKHWIARDKDGGLYLYNYEPHKNKMGRFTCSVKPNGEWSEEYELNRDLFPEVTFENSPREIELKLIEK